MAHYPPRPKQRRGLPRKRIAEVMREREGAAFDPHGVTDVTYSIHKRLREQPDQLPKERT